MASAAGWPPTWSGASPRRSQVDAHDLPVQRGGRPDCAFADGDRSQAVADRDALHDLVQDGIDLDDGPALIADHPERAAAERQRGRGEPDVDRVDAVASRWIRETVPARRIGHPHRAGALGQRAGLGADAVLSRHVGGLCVDHPDRTLRDARQVVGTEQAGEGEDSDRGDRGDARGDHSGRARGARAVRSSRRRAPVLAGLGRTGVRRRAGSCRRIRSCSSRSSALGLDADVVDQPLPRRDVGLERLGLSARPVQGQHPLRVQALPQRVVFQQSVELGQGLLVAPGGEVVVDRELGRPEPERLEPADLGRRERLLGDVGERGAAPQGERLARYRVGACGALDQALEARGVDRVPRRHAAHSRDRG